jgi:hypothetical protein
MIKERSLFHLATAPRFKIPAFLISTNSQTVKGVADFELMWNQGAIVFRCAYFNFTNVI